MIVSRRCSVAINLDGSGDVNAPEGSCHDRRFTRYHETGSRPCQISPKTELASILRQNQPQICMPPVRSLLPLKSPRMTIPSEDPRLALASRGCHQSCRDRPGWVADLRYAHDSPYEEAVRSFAPYTEVKDENPETREGLRTLIERAERNHERAYLFVNDRLEGNSPITIQEVVFP